LAHCATKVFIGQNWKSSKKALPYNISWSWLPRCPLHRPM
jgi:hypothetical protein